MATKTAKAAATEVAKGKPRLPETLDTLQFLRTAKGASDAKIASVLDTALNETTKANVVYVLERILLHIGDISRQHNILKEMGIKSDKGGAQERAIFRSIMRWWEKNLPESFAKNLRVFAEFTLLENLMFYQITTDRKTGKLLGKEILFPMPDKVHEYLANEIRKGRNIPLIARHLPKHETGKTRTARKVARTREGKTEYTWTLPKGKEWVKVNGEIVTGEKVTLKDGDVMTYPREKQSFTLERQEFINKWIHDFCKVMGWSISEYNKFRKKQNTPEQKFSSGSIKDMPKSDFMKFMDGLTAGQRYRVVRMMKNTEKYPTLSTWYNEWETSQEKIADKLREAADSGDTEAKEKLMKDYKVKATGKNTIDLLKDMFEGNFTDQQINNTYQAMIEKMDLVANVFPIVDGSASMDSPAGSGGWGSVNGKISNRDVAYAMAIAFSTRNPVEAFRNSLGWFSSNFHIVGHSKFKDNRPNRFLAQDEFLEKTDTYQILSPKNSFTKNFDSLRRADPGHVSSTNIGAAIDYFIKLAESGKFHVEDLPQALLFITDNEHNTGDSPKVALTRANKIGWNPLVIFWGIVQTPPRMMEEFKKIPNCLVTSGFNESVLSQVLRGIKSGSINPEDEIWSIVENKRYSVIGE